MAQPRVYRDGTSVPGVLPPFGKLRRLPKYGRSRGKQTAAAGSVSTISYLKLSIPISRSG